MATRKTLDERPGSMPEIRDGDDCVTFDLALTRVCAGARLIIRCDREGNAWVSISSRRTGGA